MTFRFPFKIFRTIKLCRSCSPDKIVHKTFQCGKTNYHSSTEKLNAGINSCHLLRTYKEIIIEDVITSRKIKLLKPLSSNNGWPYVIPPTTPAINDAVNLGKNSKERTEFNDNVSAAVSASNDNVSNVDFAGNSNVPSVSFSGNESTELSLSTDLDRNSSRVKWKTSNCKIGKSNKNPPGTDTAFPWKSKKKNTCYLNINKEKVHCFLFGNNSNKLLTTNDLCKFVDARNFSSKGQSKIGCIKKSNSKKKVSCPKFKVPFCGPVARKFCGPKPMPECTKLESPYGSFGDCFEGFNAPELAECCGDTQEKLLQPRYQKLPPIVVIKAPPPHIKHVDPKLERKCLEARGCKKEEEEVTEEKVKFENPCLQMTLPGCKPRARPCCTVRKYPKCTKIEAPYECYTDQNPQFREIELTECDIAEKLAREVRIDYSYVESLRAKALEDAMCDAEEDIKVPCETESSTAMEAAEQPKRMGSRNYSTKNIPGPSGNSEKLAKDTLIPPNCGGSKKKTEKESESKKETSSCKMPTKVTKTSCGGEEKSGKTSCGGTTSKTKICGPSKPKAVKQKASKSEMPPPVCGSTKKEKSSSTDLKPKIKEIQKACKSKPTANEETSKKSKGSEMPTLVCGSTKKGNASSGRLNPKIKAIQKACKPKNTAKKEASKGSKGGKMPTLVCGSTKKGNASFGTSKTKINTKQNVCKPRDSSKSKDAKKETKKAILPTLVCGATKKKNASIGAAKPKIQTCAPSTPAAKKSSSANFPTLVCGSTKKGEASCGGGVKPKIHSKQKVCKPKVVAKKQNVHQAACGDGKKVKPPTLSCSPIKKPSKDPKTSNPCAPKAVCSPGKKTPECCGGNEQKSKACKAGPSEGPKCACSSKKKAPIAPKIAPPKASPKTATCAPKKKQAYKCSSKRNKLGPRKNRPTQPKPACKSAKKQKKEPFKEDICFPKKPEAQKSAFKCSYCDNKGKPKQKPKCGAEKQKLSYPKEPKGCILNKPKMVVLNSPKPKEKLVCKIKTSPAPCKKTKMESPKPNGLWEQICAYFRARPGCPSPDDYKKKRLREIAYKAAADAGLEVCEKPKNKNPCKISTTGPPCGKKYSTLANITNIEKAKSFDKLTPVSKQVLEMQYATFPEKRYFAARAQRAKRFDKRSSIKLKSQGMKYSTFASKRYYSTRHESRLYKKKNCSRRKNRNLSTSAKNRYFSKRDHIAKKYDKRIFGNKIKPDLHTYRSYLENLINDTQLGVCSYSSKYSGKVDNSYIGRIYQLKFSKIGVRNALIPKEEDEPHTFCYICKLIPRQNSLPQNDPARYNAMNVKNVDSKHHSSV